MRDCSFHAFEGCNCGDQCKSAAIPLGRFTKPRPQPHDTRNLHYGIAGLIALAFLWWGITESIPEHRRMELVQQENR